MAREVNSVPLSLTTMQGMPSHLQNLIHLAGDPDAGQRVVHDHSHAFPAEVIDHRQHPELAARGKGVGDEVQ